MPIEQRAIKGNPGHASVKHVQNDSTRGNFHASVVTGGCVSTINA